MRVHYLQHVPFEGLGSMFSYFKIKGHGLSSTRLYLNQPLPHPSDLDWLIVMGGPMGVSDELQYPWIAAEKRFIKSVMDAGKIVLGICLGAQLIADALGARVFPNKTREIGWFPIIPYKETGNTILNHAFLSEINAFHWHGDTFDIPDKAVPLAYSKACQNQGFILGDRIVGLQFHLETTPESVAALIENCGNELDGSEFVQDSAQLRADETRFVTINQTMVKVLEALDR